MPKPPRRPLQASQSAPAVPSLVAYVRVSDGDREHAVSPADQRARIEAYALVHGFRIHSVLVDEGLSGMLPPHKRPGLLQALALLESGEAQGLVAYDLFRISRAVRDTWDLVGRFERRGWRLVSLHENLDAGTAAGRCAISMMASMGQYQVERGIERTRDAMEHLARQNLPRSRFLPFGWRVRGSKAVTVAAGERRTLEAHEPEQAVLREMLALRRRGMGPRKIARALASSSAAALNPRSGKPWTPSSVQKVLATHARLEAAKGS